MANKQKPAQMLKLTQDIVFKSFFSRNKQVLKSFLKIFLPLSEFIEEITILNLEERDKCAQEEKAKQLSDNKNDRKRDKYIQEEKAKQLNKINESREDRIESPAEIKHLNPSLLPERIEKKQVFLDLRLKLSTGENINVEMQSVSKKHFLKRILFYWSKLYSQDLNKGEDYNKLNPTYSLLFTNFPVLDKEIKDLINSYSIRRDKEPYNLLNEDLKIVIVELSKLRKPCGDLLDLKEKWCYFLKKSSELTRKEYKCLVAGEDIIVYKGEKTKEELWEKYYIQAPAQRRQFVKKYKIVRRA